MINVSYTNARGETVILDDDDRSFLAELYGREGCDAPKLEYQEITYADGTTETVLIRMKPRDVKLKFNVRLRNVVHIADFEALKLKLIQTGNREGDWGRLMIRRKDGTEAYLNCAYVGGLDEIIREYPTSTKFSLTFHAQDPLFHDKDDTEYIIRPDDESGYLRFKPLTFSGDTYDFAEDNSTSNPDGLFFKPLTFTGGTYDFSEDNSTDNPTGVFMKSAANESLDNVNILTQAVFPVITITGAAKNIRLINHTTGRKLEFAASVVVDGENYILIDTRPLRRKALQVNVSTGVATNIVGKLTADSSLDFILERGVNEILFRNSEATPESLCTLTYMQGYLSAQ